MTGQELEPVDVLEGELVEDRLPARPARLEVRDRPGGLGNVRLHLVDDFDTAWEFSQWLDGRERVAIDTESTGLKMRRDVVRLVQVGGVDEGWAFPWVGWSGMVGDMLRRNPRLRVDMHNAKFDAGMLDHMGTHVARSRIDDTMVMSQILEPNYSAALKMQAGRYVDEAAAGGQAELDEVMARNSWTWATVPLTLPQYWTYGALDTVLTARLREHHWPLIQPYMRAYDLEMAYTWVVEKMERHGMPIDVPYATEKKAVFDRYVDEAYAWILAEYGVKAGSNRAVLEVLMAAGYTFSKETASGALSLDKEVLAHCLDHPLAATVLQRRQLQRLSSAYLKHFIEDTDPVTGMIHPDIRPMGAQRTGRSSIADPSLQNLPTKSESNPAAEAVRNCAAARVGHTLAMCDFDQIEMRILAHYSADPGLAAAFRSPEDFFVVLARQVYGDDSIDKAHPLRRRVKGVGYAKIYGAGVRKMAATAGVPEAVMKATVDAFDASFFGVPRLQRQIEDLAWRRQKAEGEPYAVSCLTGRRQVADKDKVYALLNRLIQGTAAEALKLKMLELDAAGLGDYMVVPVHDEVILEVPDAELLDAVETLRRTMNDDTMFNIPISASVSTGARWGTKEEVAPGAH